MSANARTLSISEALTELQLEFPDVTISKIRFLEGQGLIDPERNASGYRQFAESDVERLTWILRQQRDRFLPLKVIKKALDRGVDIHDAGDGEQPTLWSAVADAAADEEQATQQDLDIEPERATVNDKSRHPARQTPPNEGTTEVTTPDDVQKDASKVDQQAEEPRHNTPADVVAALQEDPRSPSQRSQSRPQRQQRPVLDVGDSSTGQSLTQDELAQAAGVSVELLEELEQFGLIEAVMHGTEPYYDEYCLRIASLAGRSAERGIEPRHLRIYKVAAEREAGFIEQLVMPLLKQRNPESRGKALVEAQELATMGAEMHAAVLARELHPDLGRQ